MFLSYLFYLQSYQQIRVHNHACQGGNARAGGGGDKKTAQGVFRRDAQLLRLRGGAVQEEQRRRRACGNCRTAHGGSAEKARGGYDACGGHAILRRYKAGRKRTDKRLFRVRGARFGRSAGEDIPSFGGGKGGNGVRSFTGGGKPSSFTRRADRRAAVGGRRADNRGSARRKSARA